jgi:hypothetical protein
MLINIALINLHLTKNSPIFGTVAKTVAKPNKAKIQAMFLDILFMWKCYKRMGKVILAISS